jgi:pimeloyl-ACP methyl ester carboxylesterase
VTIALERHGAGPALVLLHPLGADRRLWDSIIEPLSERCEVIAVDLPGFGESPPLTGQIPTPRALAAALAQRLAAIGVVRPHVAGNSLGGWVALELGGSGVAGRVTAIAPAGLWPEPLVPKHGIAHRVGQALLPLVGPFATTAAGRSLLLSSAVAHPRRVPGAEAAHLVRAYATAPGFTAVNDAMRAGRFEGLERVRCPVTLVWPDHDRLIRRPVWVPDRVDNVVLTDCGHIPVWDAPDRLVELLLAGTAGLGDRPPAGERAAV